MAKKMEEVRPSRCVSPCLPSQCVTSAGLATEDIALCVAAAENAETPAARLARSSVRARSIASRRHAPSWRLLHRHALVLRRLVHRA